MAEAPLKAKEHDPRRRSYRVTPFGQPVLAEEASRLEVMVREARARLDLPPGTVS